MRHSPWSRHYPDRWVPDEDPTHSRSWRHERNAEGRVIAITFSNDPDDPRNWRKEEL